MKINIISKNNLIVTEGMKKTIEEKLSFLDKFLKPETNVNVTVFVEKDEQNIEVLFPYNNQLIKHRIKDDDFYVGMDKLVEKLKNTMSKNHDIMVNKNKKKLGLYPELNIDNDEEYKEDTNKIVKRKCFSMKLMMEEEAILQMQMLGHPTFMFLNADLDFTMCLLYKRKNGTYGIIEGIVNED